MRIALVTVLGAGCAAALALQGLAPGTAAGPAVRAGLLPGDAAASTPGGGPDGATTVIPLTAAPAGAARRLPAASPAGGAGARGPRELPARRTHRFSLLGVTWNDPRAELDGTVRARTRDSRTGRWSGWHRISGGSDDAPDVGAAERDAPGTRGGTAPLWTGPSDGVEVEVVPGRRALPAGLRVDLVDPGTGVHSAALPRVLPAAGAAAGGRRLARREYAADRPEIVTRAGWGADEKLRTEPPQYTGTVRVVFVHHTATENDYACSDADAIVRSIYRYHVKSNGWRDIGYNFLVDKCGTLYEGRAGGVSRAVLGAHTLGYNSDSAGIAAIGSFGDGDGDVPQDMLDAIARLAAWKLGLGGRDPKGTAVLGSKKAEFRGISGHRDALATQCPGDALYAYLEDVRSEAADLQGR
ncbi:peptidoglycan recognition protein [Streptomyces sp. NPDC001380]|uniref:peptidoglycan recognition protein family protein n=1 Tax=Streptomyces sp. NPDC001380 TaxID=3364566 RepID=UPI0036A30191